MGYRYRKSEDARSSMVLVYVIRSSMMRLTEANASRQRSRRALAKALQSLSKQTVESPVDDKTAF